MYVADTCYDGLFERTPSSPSPRNSSKCGEALSNVRFIDVTVLIVDVGSKHVEHVLSLFIHLVSLGWTASEIYSESIGPK